MGCRRRGLRKVAESRGTLSSLSLGQGQHLMCHGVMRLLRKYFFQYRDSFRVFTARKNGRLGLKGAKEIRLDGECLP